MLEELKSPARESRKCLRPRAIDRTAKVSRVRSFAYACRGRILAAQGKMEAAESAFDAACESAESGQHHFLTAVWLRDLCKHVLDGAGRGEEGRKRLEEAVSRLACSVEDLDAHVYP